MDTLTKAPGADCQPKDWFLVSVNPDLCNEGGHYLYFDQRLKAAAEGLGGAFLSFASASFLLEGQAPPDWVRPVFSQPTQMVNRGFSILERESFANELRGALTDVISNAPGAQVILFCYSGHAHQLPGFIQALDGFDPQRLSCVFNLYSAFLNFDETSPDYARNQVLLKTSLLGCKSYLEQSCIRIVADEEFSARAIEEHLGVRPPIMPFFSLAPEESQYAMPEEGKMTVAYLSYAIEMRGFGLLPDAVEYCLEHAPQVPWKFIFRTGLKPSVLETTRMAESIARLRDLGVTLLHGYLKDEEMASLFRQSNLLVCPYKRQTFGFRTSANVSDAIKYGLPIVAATDTWAGRLVEQLGNGVTFADGDGMDLGKALVKAAEAIDQYTNASRTAGAAWLEQNNPVAVVAFIRQVVERNVPCASVEKMSEERSLMLCILQHYLSALMHSFNCGVKADSLVPFSARQVVPALCDRMASHTDDNLVKVYSAALLSSQRQLKLTMKTAELELALLKLEGRFSQLKEKYANLKAANQKLKQQKQPRGPWWKRWFL